MVPITLAVSAKLLCSFMYTTPVWHDVRLKEREREEETNREKRKQGIACRCKALLVYKYANSVAFVICK